MQRAVRYPAHAGTFYPADPDELIRLIEWAFTHPIGPGRLPKGQSGRRESIGYIVPHAGYIYSGPVAAHSYLRLAEERKPESIVIVGPNHNGVGMPVAAYKGEAWRTPLGDVEVDMELAGLIVSYSSYLSFDSTAHYYEHSLEVQLPFIQYIYKSDTPKIVPITAYHQNPIIARDLAKAISKAITDNGVDLVVVGSTDFNHYEPHDTTVKKDLMVIEMIVKRDIDGLYKIIEENNITMCGPVSAATLMDLSLRLEAGDPILLKHATSGDVTGEKDWVVGYASLLFPRWPKT